MESRTLLAIVLSLLVLVVSQYLLDTNETRPPRKEAGNKTESTVIDSRPENQGDDAARETPQVSSLNASRISSIQFDTKAMPRSARDITVETDLYRIVFSEMGGSIKEYHLKQYDMTLSDGSPSVNLVNVSPPRLPLGLRIESQPQLDLSSHFFESDRKGLTLDTAEGEESLRFTYKTSNGIEIIKTYTFHQGSYWIDLSVRSTGLGPIAETLFLYNMPSGRKKLYIFDGPAYYAGHELHEIDLNDIQGSYTDRGQIDWIGYGDNYFLTALIPISQGLWNISIKEIDDKGLTESGLTLLKRDPQESETLKVGIYFGPKDIDRMNVLGHNLSKAINFGWFDLIAKPLLYLLKFFYKYMHNYGIAIIILTILIKIAFWPLAQKSAKSMKTMQKLQPQLIKLKEKYGNDKERLNKELLQLYKTYKVNPMGGCLPMLLQIPVFFGLYKVLLQSIELRHAPFMLWIQDLSAPDRLIIPGVDIPYLGGMPILTLLMGLSMYLQQKLSPTTLDPTQAKMMQFLPLIFTFMFINFPSGLVLYWLVNNIFSIAQQHYVNKFTN